MFQLDNQVDVCIINLIGHQWYVSLLNMDRILYTSSLATFYVYQQVITT